MGDNSCKYRRKLAGYLLCWLSSKAWEKHKLSAVSFATTRAAVTQCSPAPGLSDCEGD